MPHHIRPLTPADRPAWASLWEGYLEFYRQDLAPAVTDAVFGRLAAGTHGLRGYLLEVDGAPAGLVHTCTHANTWDTRPACYLEDLYVAPAHRGRHLGRALVEHVYAEAARAGAAQVYWHTDAANAVARRLYDRVGELSDFVRYVHAL